MAKDDITITEKNGKGGGDDLQIKVVENAPVSSSLTSEKVSLDREKDDPKALAYAPRFHEGGSSNDESKPHDPKALAYAPGIHEGDSSNDESKPHDPKALAYAPGIHGGSCHNNETKLPQDEGRTGNSQIGAVRIRGPEWFGSDDDDDDKEEETRIERAEQGIPPKRNSNEIIVACLAPEDPPIVQAVSTNATDAEFQKLLSWKKKCKKASIVLFVFAIFIIAITTPFVMTNTDSTPAPVSEPSKAPTNPTTLTPTSVEEPTPSVASCGDGICGFSEGILETCSSCPQDCSLSQDCDSIGENSENAYINEDWYGVTFKVNALKNVSFYQLEVETTSLAEERFLAKLYTREGFYDRYEGMSQWNLVFEDNTYSPIGDFRVTIPIADPLFTPAGSERSFYLSFAKGETIVFDSYYNNFGISSENEYVQLYTGEGQNSTFGVGLGNFVKLSGLMRFMI